MDKYKQLIKYSHLLAQAGLVYGSSGNISMKNGKSMLIKASGCFMEQAKKQDFVNVDIATLKSSKKSARPSCEFRMHAFCYQARRDIAYVVHTHPIYATTLISCSVKPKLVCPEFIIGIGSEIGMVEYICPGTEKLAKKVAREIKYKNVVYLKNHGLLSVGKNLQEAYTRSILAEQMAKMQVIALSMKKNLKSISKKQIDFLLKTIPKC